jgi:hypothetical protein
LMEMGREAAELLVDLIQGEQGKHTRVFPMEWVDGGSLGPVPSGKRVAGIPHVSSLGGHSPEVSVPTLCTPR